MAKTKLTSIALFPAFAFALMIMPLNAQTTEAPATDVPATEAPATEAPAADAAGADGLSMGKEVAGSAVGDTYIAASFEAWEQRCVRTATGIDPCQLYMLLKDDKDNNVAEFTMFGLPPGGEGPAVAGATFIAPLETLLTAGMSLQIDTGAPKAYPFTFCAQVGCVARLGFTAEEVAEMKKGATATIIIVPYVAPTEQVKLTLSLKGFTAGLAAVDAANAAADATVASTNGAAPADTAAPAVKE